MFPSSTLNSPLSIIYLGDPISLGIMTFSETIFPSLSLEKRLLLPQASFMLHPHPPQKTYGDYFSWLNQKLDHQKRSCLNVCTPLFCSGIEIVYIDHCLGYVSKCYLGISICNAKQRLHRLPYLHSWYESNHILLQGVQDQNLPKEIGITKKLCTSDP